MRLTEERSRDRGIEGTRMATNVTHGPISHIGASEEVRHGPEWTDTRKETIDRREPGRWGPPRGGGTGPNRPDKGWRRPGRSESGPSGD